LRILAPGSLLLSNTVPIAMLGVFTPNPIDVPSKTQACYPPFTCPPPTPQPLLSVISPLPCCHLPTVSPPPDSIPKSGSNHSIAFTLSPLIFLTTSCSLDTLQHRLNLAACCAPGSVRLSVTRQTHSHADGLPVNSPSWVTVGFALSL
jgi:hypothetical protein